eukprot:3980954-Alexandrium_andersonii.AAC.1
MSASLVGSEMCIRDRCSCRPRSHGWRPGWPRVAAVGGPGAHAITTVSYTHLTLPTICSV